MENELVHSDLGTPNRIFASKNFKKPANVLGGNHKSERQNSRPFCFLPKNTNQSEADWTDALFENVEGKSSQKWK